MTDTAQPDEFARLLGRSNDAPGAPVPAAPTSRGTAPATAPWGSPESLRPVAPAFGMAVPVPVPAVPMAAGAPSMPAPPAVEHAPEPASRAAPPPTPRASAPELLGAEQLAAPPSGTAMLPGPPPPAAPAASALAGSHTPLSFAALLSAPADPAAAASAASAPIVFGGGSDDIPEDDAELARSTLAERIGLILAILIAPLGLILGIVCAVGSARRRGWVVGIVKATIAIGAIMTVVLAIGGSFAYNQYQQQQRHDAIAAESAAFCSALTADPGMYRPPTFGWPAVAASIPDTLAAMQAFEDRWVELEKVSPAGIKADVAKVAAAAKQIIDSVTVARTVDDASNIAVLTSVASASGVPAWHSEYCV